MTYYEAEGWEESGTIKAEEAEPIINAWIDMAVNQIEQETGHKVNRDSILGDLCDDDWKFYMGEEDGAYVDIDTVYALLDDIVDNYIEWYKEDDEDEEETTVPECKLPTTQAKRPK